MLHFRVSKAELNAIREKMQELGTHNMAAYLRKNGAGRILYSA